MATKGYTPTEIQTHAWFGGDTPAASAKAFALFIAERPDDFGVSHILMTGHWISWEPTAVAEAHGLDRHVEEMSALAKSFGTVQKVECGTFAHLIDAR